MNSDTGEVRPLMPSEANVMIGERLPTGEVVVSHNVAAKLRKADRVARLQARRRMVKKSRRANRG